LCGLFSFLIIAGSSTNSFAQAPAKAQATKQSPSPPKKTMIPDVEIQGQIFIVTKGGNIIKLALVSVSAFTETDLKVQLKNTLNSEQELRNQALIRIEEAKRKVVLAKETLTRSTDNDIARSANLPPALYANAMVKSSENDQRNMMAVWAAESVVEAEKRSLVDMTKPRHLIDKLKDSVGVSKTDSDGNFNLTLPPGTYIFTAIGNRLAGGSMETYEWAVRIEAKKPTQKIMLSNDNLVSSLCNECVPFPAPL
jgi:hypothetical protein